MRQRSLVIGMGLALLAAVPSMAKDAPTNKDRTPIGIWPATWVDPSSR